MKEIGLDEIKRIQLEILDSVHEFCVKNGLRYSLCGGTLLGAVKHKGYVPYDDDIDIMMPRKDYEIFISKYSDARNFVTDFSNIDSCRELHSKVGRKGTKLIDPLLGRSVFSIFIDVCPVDGAPAEKEEYSLLLKKKLQLIPKLCAFYKVVPNHKVIWFLKYLLKRVFSGYYGNILTLKKEIRNILLQYDLKTSPFAGELIICRNANDMISAEVFTTYTEYQFEGKTYMGIKDYDTYLTMKYAYLGDYMNLPPLSKPLHEYTALVEEYD